jgi:hypothetical protein
VSDETPTCDDCNKGGNSVGYMKVEGVEGVYCLSHAHIRKRQAEGNLDLTKIDENAP